MAILYYLYDLQPYIERLEGFKEEEGSFYCRMNGVWCETLNDCWEAMEEWQKEEVVNEWKADN